jgi:DNA-binding PucR family transcriptional regulator
LWQDDPHVSAATVLHGQSQATLAGMCLDVGPELLDVVVAPRGLDIPVRDVVLHDPLDPPGVGLAAGDLVLAPGATGSDEATRDLLHAAGTADAAALAWKRRSEPPSWVLAAAAAAEVAVLSIDEAVPWGGMYGLLRASLTAAAVSEARGLPGPGIGDLLAVADAAAKMAGGPITIEDVHGRVLAFSQEGQEIDPGRMETILARRAPERWMRELRRQGVVERLMNTDEVIEVRVADAAPRRAIAVRDGATVLAAIWLAMRPETVPALADEVLHDAARSVALHLAHSRVASDVDRRVRRGMVRMLLCGEGLPAEMLTRLGLATGDELVVLAIEPADSEDTATLDRVLDLIASHLRAYRWQAVAATLDRRVYVVVALPEAGDVAALRRTVGDWLTRAQSVTGGDLRAGISSSVRRADELAAARRGADRCIDLGCTANDVVMFEAVHARALLADVEAFLGRQRTTISPQLRALLDHDAQHATPYVETLRAVLDAQSDARRAATRLEVHVNTLRYRVRRIVEIAGVDLEDPDARLALEVQLRVLPCEEPGDTSPTS